MRLKIDTEYGERRTLLEIIRINCNLSRQQLAADADTGLGTVYGAERLGRRPHRNTVRALAAALDIDYQWLSDSFDDAHVVASQPVAQEHEADVRSS